MELDPKKLGRVGVLMGGCSSEREISLKSGKAVLLALQNAGCEVTDIELKTEQSGEIIEQVNRAQIDIAFLAMHGKFGEDGGIQEILEKAGIVYTGSGPAASRTAMDKIQTQTLVKKYGIPVPEFFVAYIHDPEHNQKSLLSLGLPVVVKPSSEGSSIGVTIVRQDKDFLPALDQAFKYGPDVLVEKYVEGREITSGVLGGVPLPLVEICPKNKFFDFTAKYQKGMSDYIVPARISAKLTGQVSDLSGEIFRIVGCRDMARSDFIVDEKGGIYFLEINTIPGFTSTSLLPMAASQTGLSFADLCLTIASYAAKRKNTLALP